ncbi:HNH endonuclease [Bradyrhizobium vignae]|uniref:HNH nuclease domain-containing protein n=1 Tax=Bradyrhizobium vignae TaxID=1549949 RepID=A0A2U3PS71_9BRAD|nr:HNH endonuclease [Bradyrhizobium vignae]SPP91997.1 protein of unknown function [Bradyrhizobium vignae]
MPVYPPGSFTKNFGWNKFPPGLRRLHDVIRAGFSGVARTVSRDTFRRNCGVNDAARQLIPLNFFLHNTIVDNANYVTADELVRHAINNPHSQRFDQLALFAMHLAKMGSRIGVAGTAHGAGFTNEFVRTRLWNNGGWARRRLTEQEIERAFENTVSAEGDDTAHKCMTNYNYMMEVTGLREQRTDFLNTRIDEWIGPGLFLAFDRYSMDRNSTTPLTEAELLAIVQGDELFKLMGTTKEYVDAVAPAFAQEYLALGGMDRVSGPARLAPSGVATISSPTAPAGTSATVPVPTWSDEDAEDVATVMRRLQETQAQIRNAKHVRELKALYNHSCAFCGKQTVIGVNPAKYYSEAAHIKPVGQPHNGPDSKNNMIILCPEHHLQFDRGVLRIKKNRGALTVVSKISGDPVHGQPLRVQAPHTISDEHASWHHDFWT